MSESVTVGPQGRIVIPAALRKRLGIRPGTRLSIDVQGEALVLCDLDQRIRHRLARLRKKYPLDPGRSMVDELLADRRREAEEERREYEAWLARSS